jgi:rhamnosyltransferase subunit B
MAISPPHYLVITVGTLGDIHPFLHLARTLQSLGKQVTFITNTYHARRVEAAKIPVIGLGTHEEYLQVIANPQLWQPDKAFNALFANYGEQLRQLVLTIRDLPGREGAAVIAHPFAVPGAAIARAQGLVRSVTAAYLAPSNMRSCQDPMTIGPLRVPRWVPMRVRRALWRFVEKGWIDPLPVAQINVTRESFGLPKIGSFLGHLAEAPDLSIALFPAWFAPPAADWPRPLIVGGFQRYEVEARSTWPEGLSTFLAAGSRPVVFTPGTGNLHAAAFFSRALSAVNTLGLRAIFLTRERAQVPAELPASVIWQPYVPLSALLPQAAALVHHGGIGTTAEALRSGTPQLIAPFGWDQFDNGARTEALGAGIVVRASRWRRRGWVRSLAALIASERIRARCTACAARFAEPQDDAAFCLDIERHSLFRADSR